VSPCLYSNWSSYVAKTCQHCQALTTLPSSDNICHFLLSKFANVSYHCGVVCQLPSIQPQMNFIIHHCQAPTKCYTLIPLPSIMSCFAITLIFGYIWSDFEKYYAW
jgi:hypothetical protein